MSRNVKSAAAATALLLAACSGGGTMDAGSAGTLLMPTVYTSDGRILNSCSLIPACSGNPYAPFFASATVAPADGAVLSGIVRIEVRGNEMANDELLPATGYLPRLGVFRITGDKTVAWMDLDTTKLPNGPLAVRASAFNVPAGQPGALEIVAMTARTWNINNAASPPAGFSAAVTSAPANGAVVSGITRLTIHGSGIANAQLLPATGYTPTLGTFNVSTDRTTATLDFDSRSLPDGVRDVRISAFNMTDGQIGATEIVAMPARQWTLSNGLGSFNASVTIAPVQGEIVSGRTRLEVRGSGMKNVELLPATGYTPRLGVFNVDLNGTFAWLEFDTAALPNGVRDVRISAFDVAAGQANAREIIAMPARQWDLRH
ncbi:hypothetical protein EGT07_21965 [Herbaspirillum sp. HC18]|nr:hypothetical protein EGT07_21965 [Herbaspirillum sp. HC18]